MIKTILFGMQIVKKTNEDHVSAYSAKAAFFIMLSVIPFALLLLTSLQYTPIQRSDLMRLVYEYVPEHNGVRAYVIEIIRQIYVKSSTIIPVTAITALWSSAKAVLALTKGLNSVYDVTENRNYIYLRMRAAFYTVLLILVIIVAMLLLVFGNSIHGFFEEYVPILAQISGFIISIRTFVALAIMAIFFASVFKYLPNRKEPMFLQIPGALCTAVSWSASSFGFSLYLDIFKGFQDMYGSLTTIVLIMLWLYFCMYSLLLGAELNVALSEHIIAKYEQRKRDKERKKQAKMKITS